jgi:hypothetical protein
MLWLCVVRIGELLAQLLLMSIVQQMVLVVVLLAERLPQVMAPQVMGRQLRLLGRCCLAVRLRSCGMLRQVNRQWLPKVAPVALQAVLLHKRMALGLMDLAERLVMQATRVMQALALAAQRMPLNQACVLFMSVRVILMGL